MSSHLAVRHYIRALLTEATPTVRVPESYPVEDDNVIAKVANDELRAKLEANESSPEKTLYNKIGEISADVSKQLSVTSVRQAKTSVEDVKSLCSGIAAMLDEDADDPGDLGWPYRTSLFLTSWIHSTVNPTANVIKNAYRIPNIVPYLIAVGAKSAYESLQEGRLREGAFGEKATEVGAFLFRHILGGSLTTQATEAATKRIIAKKGAGLFIDRVATDALSRQGTELLALRYGAAYAGHPDLVVSQKNMDTLIQGIVQYSVSSGEPADAIVKNARKLDSIASSTFNSLPGGKPASVKNLCSVLGERLDEIPVPGSLPRGASPADTAAREAEIAAANRQNAGIRAFKEERDKALEEFAKVANKSYADLVRLSVAGSVVLVSGAALAGGVYGFLSAEYQNKTLTPHQVAAVVVSDTIRSDGRDAASIDEGSVMYEILNDLDTNLFQSFEDAFTKLNSLFAEDAPGPAEMKAVADEFREALSQVGIQ